MRLPRDEMIPQFDKLRPLESKWLMFATWMVSSPFAARELVAQPAPRLRRQRHQISTQTQRVFVDRHSPPRYQPHWSDSGAV